MRPIHGLLLFLTACATAPPERFKSARPKEATKEQGDLIKKAMVSFWVGGAEFDAVVDACGEDPKVAHSLAMAMIIKMDDTERLQRQRQGMQFQLRSMEDNIPYTRARATIARLGEPAMPVIEELVRHPQLDKRLRGVEVLSHMPPSVLPDIETKFAACPARYRRHYVEAVARMKPAPKIELLLLEWAKSEEFTVRAAALAGLVSFGDRHIALLREVVEKDPDEFVQRQVVRHLGGFRDRATAAAVVGFYARCVERGDRNGMREAERTLVKMSSSPPSNGGRLINYGLDHWRKWVLTVPVDGGKR